MVGESNIPTAERLSGHSEAGFPGDVVVALTRPESPALAERTRTRLQVPSGCPREDPGHVCPRSRNLYPQHGTGAAFGKARLDRFNNEVARVVTFSDSEESEEMFASDAQRAWRNAITLIAQCERLLSSDTLTVRRTDEDLTIEIIRRLKENRRRQI